MSAGLKFLGNQEPGSDQTYPDHYYIYTGAIDAFEYSITRPQEYPPNTDGRYRNSDVLAITYLAKLAVKTLLLILSLSYLRLDLIQRVFREPHLGGRQEPLDHVLGCHGPSLSRPPTGRHACPES